MDANRLDEIRTKANATFLGMSNVIAQELLEFVDHQQSEIDRLTRAYEVLEQRLRIIAVSASSPVTQYHATESLKEAQRIKDGDGEQG